MSSDAGQRLEAEMMKAVNEIDVSFLRGMKAQMFRCSAACCDDKKSSMEGVQKCINDCSSKMYSAQKFVQGEFNNFQDRLSRCHMECNDKIKDEISGQPSEYDVQKYRSKLDQCAEKCAETHIKLISKLLSRTKEYLSQNEFQSSLM